MFSFKYRMYTFSWFRKVFLVSHSECIFSLSGIHIYVYLQSTSSYLLSICSAKDNFVSQFDLEMITSM